MRFGNGAFENCESLTEARVPQGITRIDDYMFSGCKNLKKVAIPERSRRIWQRRLQRLRERCDLFEQRFAGARIRAKRIDRVCRYRLILQTLEIVGDVAGRRTNWRRRVDAELCLPSESARSNRRRTEVPKDASPLATESENQETQKLDAYVELFKYRTPESNRDALAGNGF